MLPIYVFFNVFCVILYVVVHYPQPPEPLSLVGQSVTKWPICTDHQPNKQNTPIKFSLWKSKWKLWKLAVSPYMNIWQWDPAVKRSIAEMVRGWLSLFVEWLRTTRENWRNLSEKVVYLSGTDRLKCVCKIWGWNKMFWHSSSAFTWLDCAICKSVIHYIHSQHIVNNIKVMGI